MDTRTPTPMLHAAAAIVVGLFMAVFLGQAAAQGSVSKIGMILAIGPVLFVILGLQQRVWLLIPICSAFTGKLVFLPLPFSVADMAIMAAFAVFVGLAVFKKLPKQSKFDLLDLILFINLAYLASVFMRNPVGLNIFGSERVGGYPYFAVAVSCMMYAVFTYVSAGPKLAYRLPLIMLIGGLVTFLIWLVSYVVPSTAPVIAKIYSGVDFDVLLSNYSEGPASQNALVRLSELGRLGGMVFMCLIGYYAPLTLLSPIYFGRFCLFGFSFLAMLMSGFRTQIFTSGVYFMMVSFFRGHVIDVVKAALLMIAAVIFLIAFHVSGLVTLPLAMQRALSALPIPVEWDSLAVDDARGSSEWRYEIWSDVWNSDKYIQNRWLGDGFGFTKEELNIMYSDMLGTGGFIGEGGATAQKISGAYHNGPLSAIRYVGVVGLVLFLFLAFGAAKKTINLIYLTKGTPYQPLTTLLIPAILAPVSYLLIFGAYDASLPATIAYVANLKLISRSFTDYLAAKRIPATESPVVERETGEKPALVPARSALT